MKRPKLRFASPGYQKDALDRSWDAMLLQALG
jgi:hypothetical protein